MRYKHGMTGTRIFNIWRGMINRCKTREHYLEHGITVCTEWNDFIVFHEDMKGTYKDDLSIDRINTSLGYSKENCRWTTKSIQAQNARLSKNSKSKLTGVTYLAGGSRKKRWTSELMVNRKKKHFGYFDTAEEAARTRDDYIIKHSLENRRNYD